MMRCFTDWPRFVPYEKYEDAIGRMVEKLRRYEGVISIYQMGSVSTPGISDIDMLVVFEDGARCSENPLAGLTRSDRYLFTHGLYGVTRTHFLKAMHYTFFHNYVLHWGQELMQEKILTKEEMKILKTQLSLEYLIKMYIDMTLEFTYRILKIRGFLLHTKALLYDLEFLDINTGSLLHILRTLTRWRSNWFQNIPQKIVFNEVFGKLYAELSLFVRFIFDKTNFYVPEWATLEISRNIKLVALDHFGHTHKGFVLPSAFGGLGRKYFNIQHRLNIFEVFVPMCNVLPNIVEKKVLLEREMITSNRNNLPFFEPLRSPLKYLI